VTSRVRLAPDGEGRLLLLDGRAGLVGGGGGAADAERADAAGQRVLADRLLRGGSRRRRLRRRPLQRLQESCVLRKKP
jgi:hypothetical protein